MNILSSIENTTPEPSTHELVRCGPASGFLHPLFNLILCLIKEFATSVPDRGGSAVFLRLAGKTLKMQQ